MRIRSERLPDQRRDDLSMFTNLEQKLRRTAIVGVLALLAGLVMGCQESKQKTEIEIGPNTLRAKQERQTQRLDHRAEMERERREARKEAYDKKQTSCWLAGGKRCY